MTMAMKYQMQRMLMRKMKISAERAKRNIDPRNNGREELSRRIRENQIITRTEESLILRKVACTSSDYLEKEIPTPKILFGFIREQSLTMIYARAGVGKSWKVHAISLGMTREEYMNFFLGPWCVENPCGVLLIDGELPMGDIHSRMKSLAAEMGQESADHPLTIITAEEIANQYGKTINLVYESWRNGVTDFFKSHPQYKLLILDNISSLAPGINENTKQDWDPINQWLLELRRSGVAVVIVSHANKSGSDRGHSGRLDNLDNVIRLERDSNAKDKMRITLTFEKARYLRPDQKEQVCFELVNGPNNGLILKQVASELLEEDKMRELLRLLKDKQSQKAIGEKLGGITQSRVSQLKKKALEAGYIHQDGSLTEEGENLIKG